MGIVACLQPCDKLLLGNCSRRLQRAARDDNGWRPTVVSAQTCGGNRAATFAEQGWWATARGATCRLSMYPIVRVRVTDTGRAVAVDAAGAVFERLSSGVGGWRRRRASMVREFGFEEVGDACVGAQDVAITSAGHVFAMALQRVHAENPMLQHTLHDLIGNQRAPIGASEFALAAETLNKVTTLASIDNFYCFVRAFDKNGFTLLHRLELGAQPTAVAMTSTLIWLGWDDGGCSSINVFTGSWRAHERSGGVHAPRPYGCGVLSITQTAVKGVVLVEQPHALSVVGASSCVSVPPPTWLPVHTGVHGRAVCMLPCGNAAAVMARERCVVGVWRAHRSRAICTAQVTAACADGDRAVLEGDADGWVRRRTWAAATEV